LQFQARTGQKRLYSQNRWDEVRKRYFAELDANPDAWRPVADALRGGDVTPPVIPSHITL
jgi:uncharacterized protein YeaO (DUF488 family)